MRKGNPRSAASIAHLRNFRLEHLERRNAVSTVSVAAAMIPAGSGPAPGSMILAPIDPPARAAKPSTTVAMDAPPTSLGVARVLVVASQRLESGRPLSPPSVASPASPSSGTSNIALIAPRNNVITITQPGETRHGQPSVGGPISPTSAGRAASPQARPIPAAQAQGPNIGSQSQIPAQPAMAIPAGLSVAATSPIPSTSGFREVAGGGLIRPMRLSPSDVPRANRQSSVQFMPSSSSSGSGERIPGISFFTLAGKGSTDNTDPNIPNTLLKNKNVDAVIGGSASVTTTEYDLATCTITVSGNAYQSPQNIGQRSGFQNLNYTGASGTPTSGFFGVSFFWDENPGTRIITVTSTYTTGQIGTATFTVNVADASGNLAANVLGQPELFTLPNGEVNCIAGISLGGQVSAPYVSGGGRIGIIQTITASTFITKWHTGSIYYTRIDLANLDTGSVTYPAPIIDDEGGTFYASQTGNSPNAIGTVGASGATTTDAQAKDYPGIKGISNAADSYNYATTFKDTLMYSSNGGLWVPLGSLTWAVSFELNKNASGTIALGTWTPTRPSGFTPSKAYPDWIESVAYLKSTPYGGVYQYQTGP